MKEVNVTITSAKGILHLAENSIGREKSVDPALIEDYLDPTGRNLLYFTEPLSPEVVRSQWYVKLIGSSKPEMIWLDIDKSEISIVGTVVSLPVQEENINEIKRKNNLGTKRSFSPKDEDEEGYNDM